MIASDSPSRAISCGPGFRFAQGVDDVADVVDLCHSAAEPADFLADQRVAGSSGPPPGERTTRTIAGLGS